MRHVVVLVVALSLGGTGASAAATPRFGVAGDSGKYGDDSGAFFYSTLADIGLTENRVTVLWDPDRAAEIADAPFLDRSLPVAAKNGVRIVFAVYPTTARAFSGNTRARIDEFRSFLRQVAERYPDVTTYIVGNEPNQPRFWQPQFIARRLGAQGVAAPAFEHVLAGAYDTLKSVNANIVVAGVGLSPRGNDSPSAPENVSRSPVRFLNELAAEYRRTKRKRPLMDLLSFHPYPNRNDDPTSRGYSWPNAGIPDLDRIKQAIWDGFHGTAQPTFAETGRPTKRPPMKFMLDEYARQVEISPALGNLYDGAENVPTVDEETQAAMYVNVLRRVACDPTVADFMFFHLVDERDLDRFQSGLLRVDLSHRPSYDAVKGALSSGAGCGGSLHRWRHATGVVGTRVRFLRGSVRVDVGEEAGAQVVLVPQAAPTATARASRAGAVAGPVKLVRAGISAALAVPRTAAGRFVVTVLLRATMNPARRQVVRGPALSLP